MVLVMSPGVQSGGGLSVFLVLKHTYRDSKAWNCTGLVMLIGIFSVHFSLIFCFDLRVVD